LYAKEPKLWLSKGGGKREGKEKKAAQGENPGFPRNAGTVDHKVAKVFKVFFFHIQKKKQGYDH